VRLGFLLLLISGFVTANDFTDANRSYLENDFDKAITSYQQLIKDSPRGEYYYNLGAAYFRKNSIAEAIYHFRRANEILPRDEDIKYNLEYARSLKKQQFDKSSSFLDKLQFPLGGGESLVLLFLLSCVIAGLSIVIRNKRRNIFANIHKIAILLFILFLINHINLERKRKPFVVVKKEKTKVYSGPDQGNVVLFEAEIGSEGDLENNFEKNWVQIRFSKNKKGWILGENLVM